MPELFNHTFEIELSADGSWFLKGEVEFDTDGKASFKIDESSIPLSGEGMHHFIDLMDLIRRMFPCCGGVKRIEIVQKPAP